MIFSLNTSLLKNIKNLVQSQNFLLNQIWNFRPILKKSFWLELDSQLYNYCGDWRDEAHNFAIYIFSKYLIGTGQSYRIFHKSLNYDTTLHCCCVVLSPSIYMYSAPIIKSCNSVLLDVNWECKSPQKLGISDITSRESQMLVISHAPSDTTYILRGKKWY